MTLSAEVRAALADPPEGVTVTMPTEPVESDAKRSKRLALVATSPVQGETIAGPQMVTVRSFRVPRALAEVAYVGYSALGNLGEEEEI